MNAPEGKELQAMFLILQNLFFELLYVLCAPIVGHTFDTEALEHLDPLNRPALLGIKRHNAPGHKLVLVKVVGRLSREYQCTQQAEA